MNSETDLLLTNILTVAFQVIPRVEIQLKLFEIVRHRSMNHLRWKITPEIIPNKLTEIIPRYKLGSISVSFHLYYIAFNEN